VNVPTKDVALSLLLSLAAWVSCVAANDGFKWHETGCIELRSNGRPVVQYMEPQYDDSTAETRSETSKPYHHVFSPDGTTLLTKGLGGLYPHHRGLFFGFSNITYGDGKTCDTWQCSGNARQNGRGQVWSKGSADGGESHCVSINWHGRDGEVFASEQRALDVSRVSHHGVEGWVIDFASYLKTVDDKPIHLDGDPQHAGFHFRASQVVADTTADQTYYIRTDGKGEPGDYRNWDHTNPDAPGNAECENRPWLALSFVLSDKRYTVLYIDHPDNPKPARFSERDYGRFGSYFVAEVTAAKPLDVNYRLWVQEGEMTVDQCNAIQRAYVPDLERKRREVPVEP